MKSIHIWKGIFSIRVFNKFSQFLMIMKALFFGLIKKNFTGQIFVMGMQYIFACFN